MPADIASLKENYRLYAEINHETLADQLVWLKAQFETEVEGGAGRAEVVGLTEEGRSTQLAFRGSTSEERAKALNMAIREVQAEIAGSAAPASAGACLGFFFTPRQDL